MYDWPVLFSCTRKKRLREEKCRERKQNREEGRSGSWIVVYENTVCSQKRGEKILDIVSVSRTD